MHASLPYRQTVHTGWILGSQWSANWKHMNRYLEGLEGKAFPLVGAAVADTPPSAGRSPQRPFLE